MPELNRIQSIGLDIGAKLASLSDKAAEEEKNVVPFGFEKVQAREMRRSLQLNRAERMRLIQAPDAMEQIKRLYGGRGNAQGR